MSPDLLEPFDMATLRAIFTSPVRGAAMQASDAVQVHAGCGIVGDRNYRRNNTPADQITLIEQAAVDFFNQAHGSSLPASLLRRNLLIDDAALNDLVGQTFRVGRIRLRGIELCEPCAVVGRILQAEGIPAPAALRTLAGRGGLRAEILDTGVIRVGDTLTLET